MTRRYLITGDRHWDCEDLALRVLGSITARHGQDLVIVHGACKGVDRSFARAAARLGLRDEPHPAANFGSWPGCGPRRNTYMVSLGADYAIACHPDLNKSRGTLDCVRKCIKAEIPVYLITGTDSPRLITEHYLP
jgi:hypothetical protein